MKLIAFSSLVAVAVLAGCAADSTDSSSTTQDALTQRPDIHVSASDAPNSVPARLYELMKANKNDPYLDIAAAIESASLSIAGNDGAPAIARSLVCGESDMELVGPGGQGFFHRTINSCTLTGFDQVRNGGKLPNVIVPYNAPAPLAGKLVALLEKGAQAGSFGVKKSAPPAPPCCDIPSTVTYELSDGQMSLVCTNRTGGFANIVQAQCVFSQNDTPAADEN